MFPPVPPPLWIVVKVIMSKSWDSSKNFSQCWNCAQIPEKVHVHRLSAPQFEQKIMMGTPCKHGIKNRMLNGNEVTFIQSFSSRENPTALEVTAHGTTEGRQGKIQNSLGKSREPPKITWLQEAKAEKASKLQNVQGIIYKMSRGGFLGQRNSREDQNKPEGSREWGNFFQPHLDVLTVLSELRGLVRGQFPFVMLI